MFLGMICGFIPPVQEALFDPSGPLRFLGSAVQTMGKAAPPITTMVVAASLVPPSPVTSASHGTLEVSNGATSGIEDQSPSLPLKQRLAQCAKRLTKLPRPTPEMLRVHVWFSLCRLILAPAVVVAIMMAMECSGAMANVPGLSKLVVIINAAVPGSFVSNSMFCL